MNWQERLYENLIENNKKPMSLVKKAALVSLIVGGGIKAKQEMSKNAKANAAKSSMFDLMTRSGVVRGPGGR